MNFSLKEGRSTNTCTMTTLPTPVKMTLLELATQPLSPVPYPCQVSCPDKSNMIGKQTISEFQFNWIISGPSIHEAGDAELLPGFHREQLQHHQLEQLQRQEQLQDMFSGDVDVNDPHLAAVFPDFAQSYAQDEERSQREEMYDRYLQISSTSQASNKLVTEKWIWWQLILYTTTQRRIVVHWAQCSITWQIEDRTSTNCNVAAWTLWTTLILLSWMMPAKSRTMGTGKGWRTPSNRLRGPWKKSFRSKMEVEEVVRPPSCSSTFSRQVLSTLE